MSRRSRISDTDALLRSQRRDVPNARMWSESPVPPVVGWDGLESEPLASLFNPPTDVRAFSSEVPLSTSDPTTLSVTFNAGEQVVLVAALDSRQGQTVEPGWTVVHSGSMSSTCFMQWAVLTRTIATTGPYPIVSSGPRSAAVPAPYSSPLRVDGYAFSGGEFPTINATLAGTTCQYDPATVTLHGWGGNPSAYRLRVLAGRGFPGTYMPPESGHGSMGYLNPRSNWLSPVNLGGSGLTFYEWMHRDFPAGSWSIGVYGPATVAEIHIEFGGG